MLPIKISLPESFYEEETRTSYTISPEMKAVWAVELDLLSEFIRVCKELGLKYSLEGGSMLGAVRDGKFIPWDDDIDVTMLRRDYDILIEKGGELFKDPYFLQSAYSDKEYTRRHAQLRNKKTTAIVRNEGKDVRFNQGIFLDIFVLDGVDMDNRQEQLDTALGLFKHVNYIAYHHSANPLIEAIKKTRAGIISLTKGNIPNSMKKMEDYMRTYQNTKIVAELCIKETVPSIKYFEREWFENLTTVNFEGIECTIPKEYDKALKVWFGDDYLTPRNIPTMHGMHGGMLFDAYRTYTEVLEEL